MRAVSNIVEKKMKVFTLLSYVVSMSSGRSISLVMESTKRNIANLNIQVDEGKGVLVISAYTQA